MEGFLSQQDFESVVSKGRLSNDIPWTIPIVLDVDESTASKIKDSGNVLLKNPDGLGVAVLNVEEVFTFDKEKTVKGIYGTDDNSHPGVAKTTAMNDFLVSGKISSYQPSISILPSFLRSVLSASTSLHAGFLIITAKLE